MKINIKAVYMMFQCTSIRKNYNSSENDSIRSKAMKQGSSSTSILVDI